MCVCFCMVGVPSTAEVERGWRRGRRGGEWTVLHIPGVRLVAADTAGCLPASGRYYPTWQRLSKEAAILTPPLSQCLGLVSCSWPAFPHYVTLLHIEYHREMGRKRTNKNVHVRRLRDICSLKKTAHATVYKKAVLAEGGCILGYRDY